MRYLVLLFECVLILFIMGCSSVKNNNDESASTNRESTFITSDELLVSETDRVNETDSNINTEDTSEQDNTHNNHNNSGNDLLVYDVIRLEIDGKYAFYETTLDIPDDITNQLLYVNNDGVIYKFAFFQGDNWNPADLFEIYDINSYHDIAEIIIHEKETFEKASNSVKDQNIIQEFYDNFVEYQGMSLYDFNTNIYSKATITEYDKMLICDLTIVTTQGEHLTLHFRPEVNSIRFGESIVVGDNMISMFSLLKGISIDELETWKNEKYKVLIENE